MPEVIVAFGRWPSGLEGKIQPPGRAARAARRPGRGINGGNPRSEAEWGGGRLCRRPLPLPAPAQGGGKIERQPEGR